MSENAKSEKPKSGPGGGFGGNLGKPVEKAKDFKGTLIRLLAYLKPEMFKFIMVFIFAILSTIFSIVGPKILGKATTSLFEGIMAKMQLRTLIPQEAMLAPLAANPYTATPTVVVSLAKVKAAIAQIINFNGGNINFPYIKRIILLLIILYIISALFGYIQQYIMAGVAQKTVYVLRSDVEDKLSRLPLEFFDARTHGEILSRVTNDVDNIATTLQQSLTQLVTSMATIIGVVVMMLSISPLLTMVVILTLPIYAIVVMLIAKKSQKYFAGQQKEIGALNGHVEEMYTGHKIVKAFGHEKDSIRQFNTINKRLYISGWKAQFISGMIMPLMRFISNLGYVLVSVVGGILATQGKISVGDIQAFIQYSSQFTQPIVQTANIANIIQSTVASAERVFELLDEGEEISDEGSVTVLQLPRGEVKFENVDFSYKTGEPLITNMNIDIKQGHTIAIVGPTGAGKSTLVNLLMRFYEVNSGAIYIDGINIKDINRGDLRSMFGMVLQDTWLFNGTIMENVAYGKEGSSEEEVIRATKAAHAHHFIKTLPDGYNTLLNEEASNISQGQKQLLTIARAIIANPAIMILDEATSSVDSRTEVYIQKAMAELMKNRTSFVIAHRLSTIKNAELILVMDKGSIIEMGNHYELLEQKGFYEDLYNSQFAGANLDN
ncbi:ABC transporter ATP-binding protein [Clostridium sp.]|uniref:ABC transporter ATP-binding protein n=1 Tax=Clostridium sp. TaxID=1506 RepID=UPI001A4F04CE|nr:ABC transporter ATP-binding protein [Clostridium sp.]MBK5236489.1 ABC transporter ATP-binding protein [Clostridium sp.]